MSRLAVMAAFGRAEKVHAQCRDEYSTYLTKAPWSYRERGMMKKYSLLAASLLAPVLSVFMFAPAQAEAQPYRQDSGPTVAWSVALCTPDANCRGYVEFEPDGDVVSICDAVSDGLGVRARVTNVTKDPDVREYTETNTRGAGTCVTHRASQEQPWNLAEKHCFLFAVWLVDNGSQVGAKARAQLRNYNNDGPLTCPGVD